MRIIIFTDSLGRPRPNIAVSERTEYEEVYGYQLKSYFAAYHEVELLYIESLDTQDACHWSQRMVAFRRPDLVIFHLGINDCAPRLFKKGNRSFLFYPLFRQLTRDFFLKFFSYFRYFLTRIRPLVYVSPRQFRANWQKILEEIRQYSPQVRYMAIGIAQSDANNQKSFGYNTNVQTYNAILKEIFQEDYMDINPLVAQYGLVSDNLHLTKASHKALFEHLKKRIEEINPCVV